MMNQLLSPRLAFRLSAFFACLSVANAAQYIISSGAELSALELVAGDEVVWSDGQYPGSEVIQLKGQGNAEAPITLRAETPGGVVFTGNAQVYLEGAYLVLDGFYWKGGIGVSNQVQFRKSGGYIPAQMAQNCVIRNCVFDDLQTEGDNKSRWLVLYGKGHLVERCSFLRKYSTGACVLVEMSYLEGPEPVGHTIRNNYFYDIPTKEGRSNAGDSETIRVGSSDNEGHDAGVLVEGNYFVEANGEPEIISDKSDLNRYLNNTFRRCQGALVLRSGVGALVEGNYFLGEDVEHTGGIRVSNINHKIVNNYFDSLRGSGFRAALVIFGGNVASGTVAGSRVYSYVENLSVEQNTFYDCDSNIHFMNKRYRENPSYPLSGYIKNNIVFSTRGENLISKGDGLCFQPANFQWTDNLFFGSPVGFVIEGIAEVDPMMVRADGLWLPSLADCDAGFQRTKTGPLLDAQVGHCIGAPYIAAGGIAAGR